MTNNNSGRVHYGVLLLTTLVTIILFSAVLEVKALMHHADGISDGILLSNLASAAVDSAKFVESMEIEKSADGKFDVRRMVENAEVFIDEGRAYSEFLRLLQKNQSLYGDVCEISEFIVYNFSKEKVCVSAYSNGQWNSRIFEGEEVVTPNGITVQKTSVYAKINTRYDGLFIRGRTVAAQNYVQLEINEDLQ